MKIAMLSALKTVLPVRGGACQDGSQYDGVMREGPDERRFLQQGRVRVW